MTTATTTTTPAATKKVHSIDNLPVWSRILAMSMLHALGLYGLFAVKLFGDASLKTHILAKLYMGFSTLGITAGAHRLWTHRAYKATRLGEIILMIFASMTYQNSVFTWSRDHRLHHKYSETDADPHNAKRGFFFAHVGWLVVKKHKDVLEKGREIDMSDLRANPVVMFQHTHYLKIMFLVNVLIPTLVPWYFWNETIYNAFFLNVYRYVMSVNLVWCINSVAHLYGTKPYDANIGPVQANIMISYSFGEALHNYHHTYPYDYRASEFEADGRNLATNYIDMCAKWGLAYDLKTVPRPIIDKRRERTGDGTRSDVPKLYKTMITYLVFGLL